MHGPGHAANGQRAVERAPLPKRNSKLCEADLFGSKGAGGVGHARCDVAVGPVAVGLRKVESPSTDEQQRLCCKILPL